jgi:Acyltransferase
VTSATGQQVGGPKVGVEELRVTRAIGRGLNRGLARITVTGELPATGALLLAVNHTALVDGPMLYGLLPRPVSFLVKAEVFRGPLGALLRHTPDRSRCAAAPSRPPRSSWRWRSSGPAASSASS